MVAVCGAKVHTVHLALGESTVCRPAGPALGTAVPAVRLAMAGTAALQCQPKSGTGWKVGTATAVGGGPTREAPKNGLQTETLVTP